MTKPSARPARPLGPVLFAALFGVLPWGSVWAGEASGTLMHQARSGAIEVQLRHAYLVAGPNFENRPVRVLVLSDTDLAPAIQRCDRLGCVSQEMMAGATVEFDAGPRLAYWFVANGQRVQHSGTARPATMALSQDSAKHLAGRWTLPAGSAGPNGNVSFDATLLKTFSKP